MLLDLMDSQWFSFRLNYTFFVIIYKIQAFFNVNVKYLKRDMENSIMENFAVIAKLPRMPLIEVPMRIKLVNMLA